MNIMEKINNIYDEIVQIRRDLHEQPELSEEESRTAELISRFLQENNIEHEKNIAGHGIVAIIYGKAKPNKNQKFTTVGIRGDIDALPIEECVDVPFKSKIKGVMHACGHDIHTATLMGTAKILKQLEDELQGNVKFFFEPAEETIGGAKQMIESGCLKNPDVDVVLGMHIAPDIEVGKVEFRRGKMNAASTEFEINVQGVSCHGAHPEEGIDSIVVMSHIICALQSIITRNLAPTNPGIISIGQIQGGRKNNVIANETHVWGIIRALDNNTRDYIKQRVKCISENIAQGFGAKVNIEFFDSYPALENDDEISEILEKTAERVLSKENLRFLAEPSLGADDFSYFSQEAKGLYFNVGCLSHGEKHQMLHNEYLNPHEESIRVGMMMQIFGTIDLFKVEK
ncbi:MAG: M20 family metallopeptidase [Aminipila sp.]